MNPVSAIVLYAVIWFMCLFVILPLRIKSQSETGEIVPGTPPSAPSDPMIRKKAIWTTAMATAIFIPIVVIVVFKIITIEDIDFFNRL